MPRYTSAISRLTVMLALAIFTACSGSDASRFDDQLREAEMAVAEGDMTAATSIASRLSDRHMESLTTRQLCRLSLIYMQMADSANQSDNIGVATECYRKAFETSPDSARLYYSQLGPEHTARVHMLATIVGSMDTPPSDSEPDTIPFNALNTDSHEQ